MRTNLLSVRNVRPITFILDLELYSLLFTNLILSSSSHNAPALPSLYLFTSNPSCVRSQVADSASCTLNLLSHPLMTNVCPLLRIGMCVYVYFVHFTIDGPIATILQKYKYTITAHPKESRTTCSSSLKSFWHLLLPNLFRPFVYDTNLIIKQVFIFMITLAQILYSSLLTYDAISSTTSQGFCSYRIPHPHCPLNMQCYFWILLLPMHIQWGTICQRVENPGQQCKRNAGSNSARNLRQDNIIKSKG